MALNERFFATVRSKLYGSKLSQAQVDGLEAIEAAFRKHGDGDLRKLAYIMATAHHETGGAFGPKVENLNYRAGRIREVWPTRFPTVDSAVPYANNPQKLANKVYGGRLGNYKPNDGWTYRGRAEPMLTGRAAYAKYGKMVGVDLEVNPDLILERNIGASVLVLGMLQGFTGKPLAKGVPDYVAARDSINPDKNTRSGNTTFGKLIAGYAAVFESALIAGWDRDAAQAANPQPTTPAPRANWLASLIAALVGLLKRRGV